MEHNPSVPEVLEAGLRELSIQPSGQLIADLTALAHLVAEWGERINLTGHRSPDRIARRLILDAAAFWSAIPDSPASVVDLGSGAGFPGLPVALLAPDTPVTLVESRARRHHFQREARRRLATHNVEIVRGRIEALEPRPVALAIAQAVGPATQVLDWMVGWVQVGGRVAVPGGEQPPSPTLAPGLRDPEVIRYRVPLGGPERTIWLAGRPEGAGP